MSHDKLQSECHVWMWNNYPELRYLFHSNFNDIKIVEKIIGGIMRVKISSRARMAAISAMKSLGMVKGVMDWQFYYNNTLYVIDFKTGTDRLTKEQKQYRDAIIAQGGKFYEVRGVEEFKKIISEIIM